ncbi:MAG: glycosyltransferase [Flavobacterium sp.]|nr:MAG: glycosyltransferase [Flavobacterium sp.]
MRIVQVIDSLETGGSERMAVNYANALAKRIEFSGLIPTRAEGSLKSKVESNVDYFFLEKRYTFDFRAVLRMKRYCRQNAIEYIHAHSSSYFLAIMVKCLYPKVHIIWHDHNGNSEFLEMRHAVPLNFASAFFKGIIVVNNQLKQWAVRKLHCKHVIYLANFTNQESDEISETVLKGQNGKRILSLANLREQKDHFTLLKVAKSLKASHPDWTFHLVGKDFNDEYSEKVHAEIIAKGLQETVFVYGSRNDTNAVIKQADIAILTSKSEGLPVALLEYGLQKKPVVVTSVGEIPLIIRNGENGFIVPRKNAELFREALVEMIDNVALRERLAEAFHLTIVAHHSEEAAITGYLNWIKTL